MSAMVVRSKPKKDNPHGTINDERNCNKTRGEKPGLNGKRYNVRVVSVR